MTTVKGIIVKIDDDYNIYLEDGGHAEMHPTDGGYYGTVYQNRIPVDFKDLESAWEELGNGNAYTICDSEVVDSKPTIDDLVDALHWLYACGDYEFELLFITSDRFSDEVLREFYKIHRKDE